MTDEEQIKQIIKEGWLGDSIAKLFVGTMVVIFVLSVSYAILVELGHCN